jgi:hypothetical protein
MSRGQPQPNLSLGSVTAANEAQYRLIASNAGGSATGAVATLTILSSLPNVVHLGDPITPYQPNGGSNPAAENVTNSINGTTDKYLNFGANSGAPFRGPVGVRRLAYHRSHCRNGVALLHCQ